jgi:hypothetical protein
MGRMSYAEAEGLLRRLRAETTRRHVQAHRMRQAKAGKRRLDILVTREQYRALRAAMRPEETHSAVIGRAIDALTGQGQLNREQTE